MQTDGYGSREFIDELIRPIRSNPCLPAGRSGIRPFIIKKPNKAIFFQDFYDIFVSGNG
jgi:hypothetical protein